mmetsp:Transcript_74869/g.236597  ORF Transcript_74869/g.236597 Transcript_74869/m.236597 type:complete len:299 (+) Transcript_74869:727-1623(+)
MSLAPSSSRECVRASTTSAHGACGTLAAATPTGLGARRRPVPLPRWPGAFCSRCCSVLRRMTLRASSGGARTSRLAWGHTSTTTRPWQMAASSGRPTARCSTSQTRAGPRSCSTRPPTSRGSAGRRCRRRATSSCRESTGGWSFRVSSGMAWSPWTRARTLATSSSSISGPRTGPGRRAARSRTSPTTSPCPPGRWPPSTTSRGPASSVCTTRSGCVASTDRRVAGARCPSRRSPARRSCSAAPPLATCRSPCRCPAQRGCAKGPRGPRRSASPGGDWRSSSWAPCLRKPTPLPPPLT